MGGITNPFEVILIITAFLLMSATVVGIVAPSLGFADIVPDQPRFPVLPDLNAQGNLSATYPFSETHVVIRGLETQAEVKYESFNPDKMVHTASFGFNQYGFQICRWGTVLIFPHWYDEPISFLNGSKVQTEIFNVLNPQIIANNYNGTYSTFIVDYGSKEYECFVSFSPLPGYSDMVSSWNSGFGFTVWLYGSAYSTPGWMDQVVSYLSFAASIIGFFVLYAWYMVGMASVMFTIFGLVPALSYGVIMLIITIFVGSMLMFLRGGQSK